VRPTNVMGASKRLCELLLPAYRGNGTKMMSVRSGSFHIIDIFVGLTTPSLSSAASMPELK
jgi:hypothetical protein